MQSRHNRPRRPETEGKFRRNSLRTNSLPSASGLRNSGPWIPTDSLDCAISRAGQIL